MGRFQRAAEHIYEIGALWLKKRFEFDLIARSP